MSLIVGVPDFTPDEGSEKLKACMERGHRLRLFTDDGVVLHTNQNWQGHALGIGCQECNFVLFAPLSPEDERVLASECERLKEPR
jgi:hypothetical protein